MNDCTTSKLTRVTGKKISVKLKYGYTIDDFIRDFDCTKEEFIKFLQKNFEKTSCNRILAEAEKNYKKKNCNKKSSSLISENSVYTENKLITTVFDDVLVEQQSETQDNVSEEQLSETQLTSSSLIEEERLQNLKDEEKILRDSIISKENEHKNLIAKRKQLFKKLETQRSMMLQLRKTIEQRKKEVEEISAELISLSDEIVSVNSFLSTERTDLLNIQNKIKELEKISVFIYENGEIDTDNFLIDIPETWNDVFENILRNEVVENLSIKQIKQIAKLIVLTGILNANSLEYELTFESENSQKAFYELDKAMS